MRKALFFFGIMSDSDLEWMISVGKRRLVPSGDTIIEEGKQLDHVYVVIDGELVVTTAALHGNEIARLRSGEIVGEMSFVDSRPPSASVSAARNSVLLSIPSRSLRARLTEAEFAARFYRALSIFLADRMRSTVSRLGYGGRGLPEPTSEDELSPDLLDNVSRAGARFDWLVRRLEEQGPID